jgi:hypothetical protein
MTTAQTSTFAVLTWDNIASLHNPCMNQTNQDHFPKITDLLKVLNNTMAIDLQVGHPAIGVSGSTAICATLPPSPEGLTLRSNIKLMLNTVGCLQNVSTIDDC